MLKLKEIIRCREAGVSQRTIAKRVHASPSTINKYIKLCNKSGINYERIKNLSDDEIDNILFPYAKSSCSSCADIDYEYTIKELSKRHVTLKLTHEEYMSANPHNPYGYSRYCDLISQYRKDKKLSFRQSHNPGEKMWLDFAGPTVPIYDITTGKVSYEAQIFCASLGVSGYAYCEALRDQKMESWFYANRNAFDFYGGIPAYIVPDNLKAGVTKADNYDPDINPEYANFASYYNTIIYPTRPRKPKDKPKVEQNVQMVERRILARLRNHKFYSLGELNIKIKELIVELNEKPYQKLEGCRLSAFTKIDKPALQSLPTRHYELGKFIKQKVTNDYHIHYDKHYYSLPYEYVGKKVDIRITLSSVEIFYKSKRIACHKRSEVAGKTTCKLHMPKAHLAMIEWDIDSYKSWSQSVGEETHLVMNILLEKYGELRSLRAARGIKKLTKKIGNSSLECACQFANRHKIYSFKFIRDIITGGTIQFDQEISQSRLPKNHSNIRGANYFDQNNSPLTDIVNMVKDVLKLTKEIPHAK